LGGSKSTIPVKKYGYTYKDEQRGRSAQRGTGPCQARPDQARQGSTTGLACKGSETLGKGFVECCPRQRLLGEFLDGEGVFAEGPLSGTWQSLCRGPERPWAKKRSRHALAPLAVSLSRADPRQRNDFFLNFFCRGSTLGKEFFLNLCRGPPPWPLAKKFSGFFPKKTLPRDQSNELLGLI